MKFHRIDDVVSRRLCMGCGACASTCSEKAISLVDIPDQGIRPIVDKKKCRNCGRCIEVCVGIKLVHKPFCKETVPQLRQSWGPVLEVWEGYAADEEIRFKGSSGGAATALALYCIEKEKMSGVLQIGADSKIPWKSDVFFSTDKQSVLACTGSRYCPSAVCRRFDLIKQAKGAVGFVGKPCDVAALERARAIEPLLNDKVGLTISIFCAGVPATSGTRELLTAMGISAEEVEELRYRGSGWPGKTTARIKGKPGSIRQMSYEQSWGEILSKHGPLRCRLCPDGTGEFSDIACGDPWYREILPDEPGWSLVLARTEKGKDTLKKALDAGYIKLRKIDIDVLSKSQKSLLRRRRHLWGRLTAMRVTRVGVPDYRGFSLFENWMKLPFMEKLSSILGTLRRIMTRGWRKPIELSESLMTDNRTLPVCKTK
jgi:coenzyme F420 hydrogenase subunit beta